MDWAYLESARRLHRADAGLTKQTNGGAVWTGEMRRASDAVLLVPLKRKKPTTYFVNSMSDLFHENVPDEWIDRIFAVMALSPQHTFQVLTKRAQRMRETVERIGQSIVYLEKQARSFGRTLQWNVPSDLPSPLAGKTVGLIPWPLKNVWLGVSTERQQEADERIPLLLQTPATVRFISAEPLLGPIDLRSIAVTRDWPEKMFPDWVIVGGESGHGYRPMAAEWAYSLRDQCIAAGVPVFIKQMAGKKPIPEDLIVRQFPN
jgi:protein gp37